MPNFPTPSQIVETLNECKSYIGTGRHPRQGEVQAAKYIHGLAQQFGLGVSRLVPIAKDPKFKQYAEQEPGLANVVIEAGMGDEELLVLHGHFDVVPPNEHAPQAYKIVEGEMPGELRGRGSYDMLPGVAAILTSLRKLTIDKRRRVRAVLVFGEEHDSEGTHSAFDPEDDLFAFPGRRAALSTEITVGADIEDPYHLVIGRPGRYTYDMEIQGRMKHSGSVRPSDVPHTVTQRLAKAEVAIMNMAFPPHPNDKLNLMQGTASYEYPTVRPPGSLSMGGDGYAKINVHYSSPHDSGAHIQRRMYEAIADALGDERFTLKKIERTVPWLQPWLENTGPETFADTMKTLATKAAAQQQASVPYRVGEGTADDCIIGQKMRMVCIPPKGGNPHEETEHGNINSVDFQVATIQAAAAYEGQLIPDDQTR